MKKIRMMGLTLLVGLLISGCGCSKVDEDTYASAVSDFESTDALSFSRIEIIQKEGEDTYTRKKVDAKYTFDSSKYVTNMEYSRMVSIISNTGGSTPSETYKYYYSGSTNSVYTYSKIGSQNEQRVKDVNVGYNAKFNVNSCQDLDCSRMIVGNFAPVFDLDEVTEFIINDNEGIGEVTFKAICPSYESCSSSSQEITYNLIIDTDGNIESMSYDVVNGDVTHSIKYTFYDYGSNNVKITFPEDLESYIEK